MRFTLVALIGNWRARLARIFKPRTIPAERVDKLRELEGRIHHTFRDLAMLDAALTHRSFAHEQHLTEELRLAIRDYESLEFLGDSVLGLIISEYLFRNYPSHSEGELSKMKSFLVSTTHLAKLSRTLGLGEFMRLSHGEEKTGGRSKRAILADLVESLTAALYLDGGFEKARAFVLDQFEVSLTRLAEKDLDFRDNKSQLQERLHQMGFGEPEYNVVNEAGPPHRREFKVAVAVDGRSLADGEGRSKKEAQQSAARVALNRLAEVDQAVTEQPPVNKDLNDLKDLKDLKDNDSSCPP